MKKTAIFGGSFNPVHMAHLVLAEAAAEAAGLERVVFVPAAMPPHKPQKTVAEAHHRVRMLRLAVAGNPRFGVSEIELRRNGPSYTLTTVREFQERCCGTGRIFLLLGADSVRDLHLWHRAAELIESVGIIGLRRPDVDEKSFEGHVEVFGARKAGMLRDCFVPAPRMEISASGIRRRVREGRSVRYLVPDAVRDYIARERLYLRP